MVEVAVVVAFWIVVAAVLWIAFIAPSLVMLGYIFIALLDVVGTSRERKKEAAEAKREQTKVNNLHYIG
jgi:hypothetical protein